jgi:hypothetical protein
VSRRGWNLRGEHRPASITGEEWHKTHPPGTFPSGDAHPSRKHPERIPRGENSPEWKGDAISKASGRARARRQYKTLGQCELCDDLAVDRHHRDDNPRNNDVSNIQYLCRACHMKIDGRAAELSARSSAPRPIQDPKPCDNCASLYKPLRKGLCSRCYAKQRYDRRKA